MKTRSLLLATVVAAASCGDGGTPGVSEFTDACVASANLERPVCECVAQKAREELSPQAFEFLLASIGGDDEETAALRAELPVKDAMGAGMFMVGAPGRCAMELAD